jgi:hypothetical protein
MHCPERPVWPWTGQKILSSKGPAQDDKKNRRLRIIYNILPLKKREEVQHLCGHLLFSCWSTVENRIINAKLFARQFILCILSQARAFINVNISSILIHIISMVPSTNISLLFFSSCIAHAFLKGMCKKSCKKETGQPICSCNSALAVPVSLLNHLKTVSSCLLMTIVYVFVYFPSFCCSSSFFFFFFAATIQPMSPAAAAAMIVP